jgi:hypothetical protein
MATLWSVGNETAQKAAKTFYEELSKDTNMLHAIFRMAKSISILLARCARIAGASNFASRCAMSHGFRYLYPTGAGAVRV